MQYLVRIEFILILGLKKTLDQEMQQLLSDVPIGAVVEVWQNQSYEVVVLLVAATHYIVDERQAFDCFLPDYVFAIG
jgi:hypothetical protein